MTLCEILITKQKTDYINTLFIRISEQSNLKILVSQQKNLIIFRLVQGR